jgi:KDO2-lipid IV(A) lauroyltransferase
MFKKLRYALETALAYAAYGFFRLFPVETASAIGGWIGRQLGPHLPSSETARKNLATAFPEKTAAEREKIVIGMWDNLGRVMAEYAHLPRISKYVSLTGEEYGAIARDSGKPHIFCGGHIANWEIPPVMAKKIGFDMYPVYRRPNNPGVDALLHHARGVMAAGLIAKGASGAREMLAVLKKNGTLGILIDQKLNEGMSVPFFGRDAMTAPALAHLAFRYDCPVHPVRVERLEGCNFKMTVYPPLATPRTGNRDADTRAMLVEINRLLESWIRERPEQWLWIHRRWRD